MELADIWGSAVDQHSVWNSVDNGTAIWQKSLSNQKDMKISPANLQQCTHQDHSSLVESQFTHQLKAKKTTSQQVPMRVSRANTWKVPPTRSQVIQKLVAMGFQKEDAQEALIHNNMDIATSIVELISNECKFPVANQYLTEPADKHCQLLTTAKKTQMNPCESRQSPGRKSCFSPPDNAYLDEYHLLRSFDDLKIQNVVTSASNNPSTSCHTYDVDWSGGQYSVPNSWLSCGSNEQGSDAVGFVLPITPSVGHCARGAFNTTEIIPRNNIPASSQLHSLSKLKQESEFAVLLDSSCDSSPWNKVQRVSSQTCSLSGFKHVGGDEQPVMSYDKEEEKRTFETKNTVKVPVTTSGERLSIREFVPGQLWASSSTASDQPWSLVAHNTSVATPDKFTYGIVDDVWLALDNNY